MGHVTQLANTLQYASEERAEVAQHVTDDPDWQHYVTSSLQPQNTVCFCKPRGLIYCRVQVVKIMNIVHCKQCV